MPYKPFDFGQVLQNVLAMKERQRQREQQELTNRINRTNLAIKEMEMQRAQQPQFQKLITSRGGKTTGVYVDPITGKISTKDVDIAAEQEQAPRPHTIEHSGNIYEQRYDPVNNRWVNRLLGPAEQEEEPFVLPQSITETTEEFYPTEDIGIMDISPLGEPPTTTRRRPTTREEKLRAAEAEYGAGSKKLKRIREQLTPEKEKLTLSQQVSLAKTILKNKNTTGDIKLDAQLRATGLLSGDVQWTEQDREWARNTISRITGGELPESTDSVGQFREGAVYRDAQGNRAIYQNGKWVPIE